MFREMVLGVGENPLVKGTVGRYGMRFGARRFVAGETLDEALGVVKDLNRRRILTTLDYLGEAVESEPETVRSVDRYLETLDAIERQGGQSNVSLKLTSLGLSFNPELAEGHLRKIVEHARTTGNFVRIDMEESRYTTSTLDIFERVYEAYPGSVGVVLQAYLYRTAEDLVRLSAAPKNFRIVKGAYQEPVAVAFPSKPDVDQNYFRLVERSMELGNYTAIATHDEAIIGRVMNLVHRQNISRDRFEFQMLYGVKLSVLEGLAREGYTTRVYVPFGRDWYAYYVRRIAERPANLLFFARALIDRK